MSLSVHDEVILGTTTVKKPKRSHKNKINSAVDISSLKVNCYVEAEEGFKEEISETSVTLSDEISKVDAVSSSPPVSKKPAQQTPSENETHETHRKSLLMTDCNGLNLHPNGKVRNFNNEVCQMDFFSNKAFLMMAKMGYKTGTGLGKQEDGLVEPVNLAFTLGNRGLGYEVNQLEPNNETWDFSLENISVEEKVNWLTILKSATFPSDMKTWKVMGRPKEQIEKETNFVDPQLLHGVLRAKDIFEELDVLELCKARARANPFETIRSAFFMNRAALKMANIDAVTDFMFTGIDRNPNFRKPRGPYYFADVCAGPGGFTEYVLWRKKWLFKAFGFTLKDDHDFEVAQSQCASPVSFSAQYGSKGDGDVCRIENIRHFAESVRHESEGVGVHFMMADGGFSVEGNENLQEILSKQLYVSQCLMALEIIREHGHFVTKLFDIFTPFSVGLIFLMYHCFAKIAIIKPNTSRPANSERYLLCCGLKPDKTLVRIRKYLSEIVKELRELKTSGGSAEDINEIVPLCVMKSDNDFFEYVVESNNRIASNQIIGLRKLATFCRNPALFEPRQDELRSKCLKYWQIPNKPKMALVRFTINDLLTQVISNQDFLFSPPKQICDIKQFEQLIGSTASHYYAFSGCPKKNGGSIFAGVGGSKVFQWQGFKWHPVKKLQLICGTLLYGEMVTETSSEHPYKNVSKPSLHVFDALRLGDTSLADLSFTERLALIETYCEAINHESQSERIRVRAKSVCPLKDFDPNENLTTLGFNSIKETYPVNSVLVLKAGKDESFYTTFESRIQLFITNNGITENNSKVSLPLLEDFIKRFY